MNLLPCPFCGEMPKSTGRPTTPGEPRGDKLFVHFITCYCGGYSATAHKMGVGITEHNAECDAVTKWNTRYN